MACPLPPRHDPHPAVDEACGLRPVSTVRSPATATGSGAGRSSTGITAATSITPAARAAPSRLGSALAVWSSVCQADGSLVINRAAAHRRRGGHTALRTALRVTVVSVTSRRTNSAASPSRSSALSRPESANRWMRCWAPLRHRWSVHNRSDVMTAPSASSTWIGGTG